MSLYGNKIAVPEDQSGFYPGAESLAGFLDRGEGIREVILGDLETLSEFGISTEMVADKINEVFREEEEDDDDEKPYYVTKIIRHRGPQPCPYGCTQEGGHRHPPQNTNLEIFIQHKHSGIEQRVTGLHEHLIGDHFFFEGNAGYRLDPVEFGITTGLIPYTSETREKWRNVVIRILNNAPSEGAIIHSVNTLRQHFSPKDIDVDVLRGALRRTLQQKYDRAVIPWVDLCQMLSAEAQQEFYSLITSSDLAEGSTSIEDGLFLWHRRLSGEPLHAVQYDGLNLNEWLALKLKRAKTDSEKARYQKCYDYVDTHQESSRLSPTISIDLIINAVSQYLQSQKTDSFQINRVKLVENQLKLLTRNFASAPPEIMLEMIDMMLKSESYPGLSTIFLETHVAAQFDETTRKDLYRYYAYKAALVFDADLLDWYAV